jgi:putative ABC transport system substrate-binding protein
MAGGPDPVKYRLVESLSRPGGNITGVTSLHNELAGKRLSLLRDMVPQAIRFGYLTNDPRGNEVEEGKTSEMIAAAHSLGREVVVAECRGVGDFEPAFATLVERGASALVVSAFPLAFNNRRRILALAARYKLPAIYPQTQYAFGGGLMSYCAVGTCTKPASTMFLAFSKAPSRGSRSSNRPIQAGDQLKTAKALGPTFHDVARARRRVSVKSRMRQREFITLAPACVRRLHWVDQPAQPVRSAARTRSRRAPSRAAACRCGSVAHGRRCRAQLGVEIASPR